MKIMEIIVVFKDGKKQQVLFPPDSAIEDYFWGSKAEKYEPVKFEKREDGLFYEV